MDKTCLQEFSTDNGISSTTVTAPGERKVNKTMFLNHCAFSLPKCKCGLSFGIWSFKHSVSIPCRQQCFTLLHRLLTLTLIFETHSNGMNLIKENQLYSFSSIPISLQAPSYIIRPKIQAPNQTHPQQSFTQLQLHESNKGGHGFPRGIPVSPKIVFIMESCILMTGNATDKLQPLGPGSPLLRCLKDIQGCPKYPNMSYVIKNYFPLGCTNTPVLCKILHQRHLKNKAHNYNYFHKIALKI